MYQLNQQKKVIATVIVAVLALSVITFTSRTDIRYKTPEDKGSAQQEAYEKALKEYNDYIQSIGADPVASRQIVQELITEEMVLKHVNEEFDVEQKISLPTISNDKFNPYSGASVDQLQSYFDSWDSGLAGIEGSVSSDLENGYQTQSPQLVSAAKAKIDTYLKGLYSEAVPKEVLDFHKYHTSTIELLSNQVKESTSYLNLASDEGPWSKLYHDYMATQDLLLKQNAEAKKLSEKYALVLPKRLANVGDPSDDFSKIINKALGVKTASAFLGGPVVVLEDIPYTRTQILKQFWGYAFTIFGTTQVSYWAKYLTNNLAIGSLLTYADALDAKYIDESLDKYLPNNKEEQEIVKKLIPKLNCGLNLVGDELRPALQKKTLEYLGFNPDDPLDENSPDFYEFVSRAGHLMSSADGQKQFWSSVAKEVEEQSSKATDNELNSSGFKSIQLPGGKGIKIPTSSVVEINAANFLNGLNIGNATALDPAGKIAAQIMVSIINNIIFTGGAVLQEAKTCIAPTQYSPVQAVQAPDQTLPVPDNGTLDACVQDPTNCPIFNQPNNNAPDPNQSGLRMDKNSYQVGEVWRFSLKDTGEPAGTEIGWVNDRILDPSNPSATPISTNAKFEGQILDENGEFSPGAWFPYDKPFTCADIGSWRKTVTVGSKTFSFNYTVTDRTPPVCS